MGQVVCCLAVVAVLLCGTSLRAETWKFAVTSDVRTDTPAQKGGAFGVNTSVLGPIAKDIAGQKVDLVLFPGDLALGNPLCGTFQQQLGQWKKTMAPLYDAKIPVLVVRGNHETNVKASQHLIEDWKAIVPLGPDNGPEGQKGLTYSVDHKNARFVGFDQYVGRSKTFDKKKYDDSVNSGVIHPWVIDQISSAPSAWVFAFGHEMAWTEAHSDCLANAPAERDALWDALGAKHGVYFCGHDHIYARRTAPDSNGNPVTEIVVGCGGAPEYYPTKSDLNASIDKHVVPTVQFINAGLDKSNVYLEGHNTDCLPPYFGYLLITIDGDTAKGEWRAFVNYEDKDKTAPAVPEFKTLNTFTLKR
jgi:hypothetical protein